MRYFFKIQSPFFGEERLYLPVATDAGSVDAAIGNISLWLGYPVPDGTEIRSPDWSVAGVVGEDDDRDDCKCDCCKRSFTKYDLESGVCFWCNTRIPDDLLVGKTADPERCIGCDAILSDRDVEIGKCFRCGEEIFEEPERCRCGHLLGDYDLEVMVCQECGESLLKDEPIMTMTIVCSCGLAGAIGTLCKDCSRLLDDGDIHLTQDLPDDYGDEVYPGHFGNAM